MWSLCVLPIMLRKLPILFEVVRMRLKLDSLKKNNSEIHFKLFLKIVCVWRGGGGVVIYYNLNKQSQCIKLNANYIL